MVEESSKEIKEMVNRILIVKPVTCPHCGKLVAYLKWFEKTED